VERGVDLLDRIGHRVLQRVDELRLAFGAEAVEAELLEARRDILLTHHERHEHVLVGQFLGVGLGVKAVEHVVVLDGRMRADALKSAVMVGEYQSFGTHHDTRAIAREVHHGVLHGLIAIIERVVGQLETLALHLGIDRRGQVVERPHTLVGMQGREVREVKGEKGRSLQETMVYHCWMFYDFLNFFPMTGSEPRGKSFFTI